MSGVTQEFKAQKEECVTGHRRLPGFLMAETSHLRKNRDVGEETSEYLA